MNYLQLFVLLERKRTVAGGPHQAVHLSHNHHQCIILQDQDSHTISRRSGPNEIYGDVFRTEKSAEGQKVSCVRISVLNCPVRNFPRCIDRVFVGAWKFFREDFLPSHPVSLIFLNIHCEVKLKAPNVCASLLDGKREVLQMSDDFSSFIVFVAMIRDIYSTLSVSLTFTMLPSLLQQ